MHKFFYKIFNSKLKYLFLIPIILMITFALYFDYIQSEINRRLLDEKCIELSAAVDLVAYSVDKFVELDEDWNPDRYIPVISHQIEELDNFREVFAAAYDDQLNLVTERFIPSEVISFDPLTYPEFLDEIRQNQSGEIELIYKRKSLVEYTINVYYRWIPENSAYTDRYLIAIGITEESIITQMDYWLTMGMILLILITFLINTVFVLLLSSLGHVYSSRNGEKWRSPN